MNEVHMIYMKPTSKETYKILRAVLKRKKFTQYEISKEDKITFSLVNRVINWLLSRDYVAKREGYYELTSAGAIFNLFPLYRRLKPFATFDIDLSEEKFMKMIKGKGILCLTSALTYYDDYYRDKTINIYLEDEELIKEIKNLPKGYTHIELYKEDLNKEDFIAKKGQKITNKIRTVIDLFCSNKAYAAERLIKKEWI